MKTYINDGVDGVGGETVEMFRRPSPAGNRDFFVQNLVYNVVQC